MKYQMSLTIQAEVVFSWLAQIVERGAFSTEEKPAKSWFLKIAEV